MKVKELKALLRSMPDESLVIMQYDQEDSFLSRVFSAKACDYSRVYGEINKCGTVFNRHRELDFNQTVVVLKGSAGLNNIFEHQDNMIEHQIKASSKIQSKCMSFSMIRGNND